VTTAKGPRLTIVPSIRDDAAAFIDATHRKHGRPTGYLFAVAVADESGKIVGVATVGRPCRALQNGWTCEVTRCSTDGTPNACSALYRAAWRAARGQGYRRMVTFTEADEPGTSLLAAGFIAVATRRARPSGYDTPSRRRTPGRAADRVRWEINAESPPWKVAPRVRLPRGSENAA